ncbi:hypothetical protein Q6250_28675, partial [Klebsiella pneumoniae]|nr:hypothetical protein [Klebsiella pneumoniae]
MAMKTAWKFALATKKMAIAMTPLIHRYRQQGERLRDEELSKAQRLLANGSSAEEVLMQLARGLTNKLLHAPSVQLKKLTAEG